MKKDNKKTYFLLIFVLIIISIIYIFNVNNIIENFNPELRDVVKDVPDINKNPLNYVFEEMKLNHKPDTLWLEFGVFSGNSINYISKFTKDKVYGFDSFEGLPEKWRDNFDKGMFNMDGKLPQVNDNVVLIKGWFNDTLEPFLNQNNKLISFIHIDCDIYSSTKYIFDAVKHRLDKDCVIIFDELINYDGYDEENGELKAFNEFIKENNVKYNWIGMKGKPNIIGGSEQVGVIINKVN